MASQAPKAAPLAHDEVTKFAKIGAEWWDPKAASGAGPLHTFNPVRVGFLRDSVISHIAKADKTDNARALSDLDVLDVGCGGGLLSEALARIGGNVTGIDPSPENIGVASVHARSDPLTRGITYRAVMVQDLLDEQQPAAENRTGAEAESLGVDQKQKKNVRGFDVVISSEVIEHVDNPADFVRAMAALLRPGGVLCMSTINRTAMSFAKAIVGAEYVARLVPIGTHSWGKFVTPAEMDDYVRRADPSLRLLRRSGVTYNPFRNVWSLQEDESVNYIASYGKPARK